MTPLEIAISTFVVVGYSLLAAVLWIKLSRHILNTTRRNPCATTAP